jgi:hypothetical protein
LRLSILCSIRYSDNCEEKKYIFKHARVQKVNLPIIFCALLNTQFSKTWNKTENDERMETSYARRKLGQRVSEWKQKVRGPGTTLQHTVITSGWVVFSI